MEEHVAAKCIAHPLRREILDSLRKGAILSPNELADKLDNRLTNISYHVRMLHNLGAIELVGTAQRRGALEHYYRLTYQIPRLRAKQVVWEQDVGEVVTQ